MYVLFILQEDRRGRGEIYVMLKYVMKKLERIDGRYERMERKLEKIEGRLEKMEDKMERRVVEQVEVAKEPKTEGGEQTEEFKVSGIHMYLAIYSCLHSSWSLIILLPL